MVEFQQVAVRTPHHGTTMPPTDPRRAHQHQHASFSSGGSTGHHAAEMLGEQHSLHSSPSVPIHLQPLPPGSDWARLQQCVSELRVALSRSTAEADELRDQVRLGWPTTPTKAPALHPGEQQQRQQQQEEDMATMHLMSITP